MKVVFLKSPTGAFGLAYNKGDEVDLTNWLKTQEDPEEVIDQMQKGGFIEVSGQKNNKK